MNFASVVRKTHILNFFGFFFFFPLIDSLCLEEFFAEFIKKLFIEDFELVYRMYYLFFELYLNILLNFLFLYFKHTFFDKHHRRQSVIILWIYTSLPSLSTCRWKRELRSRDHVTKRLVGGSGWEPSVFFSPSPFPASFREHLPAYCNSTQFCSLRHD